MPTQLQQTLGEDLPRFPLAAGSRLTFANYLSALLARWLHFQVHGTERRESHHVEPNHS